MKQIHTIIAESATNSTNDPEQKRLKLMLVLLAQTVNFWDYPEEKQQALMESLIKSFFGFVAAHDLLLATESTSAIIKVFGLSVIVSTIIPRTPESPYPISGYMKLIHDLSNPEGLNTHKFVVEMQSHLALLMPEFNFDKLN